MKEKSAAIRRLRRSDINRYVRARLKLWPHHSVKEFKKDVQGLLKKKTFFAWVIEGTVGEIAGFVEASIRPFANGCRFSPVFFLEGIWVDHKSRRSGISRSLLSHIENFAKKQGFKEIGSDCLSSNKVSTKIHLRWGFSKTMDVVYFRKSLPRLKGGK